MDKMLLLPGWAGELDDEELAYVKTNLKKDPALKNKWFEGNISDKKIRVVAMWGNNRWNEVEHE